MAKEAKIHIVKVYKVSKKGIRKQIAEGDFVAKNFLKKVMKKKVYLHILLKFLAKYRHIEICFENSEDLTQIVTYSFEILKEKEDSYAVIGFVTMQSCDLGFECYKTGFEV